MGYLEDTTCWIAVMKAEWRPQRMYCFPVLKFDTLVYATELGYKVDRRSLESAAVCGDLEAMKFMHEKGFPMDKNVGYEVANAKNVPCLEYFLEQGGQVGCSVLIIIAKVDGWKV